MPCLCSDSVHLFQLRIPAACAANRRHHAPKCRESPLNRDSRKVRHAGHGRGRVGDHDRRLGDQGRPLLEGLLRHRRFGHVGDRRARGVLLVLRHARDERALVQGHHVLLHEAVGFPGARLARPPPSSSRGAPRRPTATTAASHPARAARSFSACRTCGSVSPRTTPSRCARPTTSRARNGASAL